MKWPFILFYLAALPSVAVAGWVAVDHARRYWAFLRTAEVTDGTMLAPQKQSGGGDTMWVFTGRFAYMVDGKKYVGKNLISTNWNTGKKGKRVRVYYLQEHPERASIRPIEHAYIGAIAFILFIVIVFLIYFYSFMLIQQRW